MDSLTNITMCDIIYNESKSNVRGEYSKGAKMNIINDQCANILEVHI